jgi:tRNA (cmo5U34)-methyltransferase
MFKISRLPLVPLIVARERLTHNGAPRQPEPMVMDDLQGAVEYDRAGEALMVPIHHANALALSALLPEGGVLVDLGCGSGRLLARLAHARPDARLVGLDLSEPMLDLGRQMLARQGLADRVELRPGDITNFDVQLEERPNVVSCNFTLHQLPSEELVSRCLQAIHRMRERTGCAVYIFDFARLRNARTWPALISLVHLPGLAHQRDSIASERAAFTFTELSTLLRHAGFVDLRHERSRLVGEYQRHWVGPRQEVRPARWHDVPLPKGTRLATRMIARAF